MRRQGNGGWVHRAEAQCPCRKCDVLGVVARDGLAAGARRAPAASAANVEQPSDPAGEGAVVYARVAGGGAQTRAGGLSAARPALAGAFGRAARGLRFGAVAFLRRLHLGGQEPGVLPAVVAVVRAATAVAERRIHARSGLDAPAPRRRTSGRRAGGLHARGRETVSASAPGRAARSAAGRGAVAARRPCDVRQQRDGVLPRSLAASALARAAARGAGRQRLLPAGTARFVGATAAPLHRGGAGVRAD